MTYTVTPSACTAAARIAERAKNQTLTDDPAKLAEYLDKETGLMYLVAACKAVLHVDSKGGKILVDPEVRKQVYMALLWAGIREGDMPCEISKSSGS